MEFVNYGRFLIKPYSIILVVLVILLTLLFTRIVKNYSEQNKPNSKRVKKRSIFWIILILWIISLSFIAKIIVTNYTEIAEYTIINFKDIPISVSDIFLFLFIIVITSLFLMILNLIIKRQVDNEKIDIGTSSAIYQILKYFVWIIALSIAIRVAGFELSILLAGSAALLVGLGMGIKEIFSDVASGIILLMERTLIVGDIIEVDGLVGKVKNIGLRTTSIITRDNTWIIVPNSKFTRENLLNWSHGEKNTRFSIEVGVAYGSDVHLVMEVLKECAKNHDNVSDDPTPIVIFENFNDFSLDFKLYFWTTNAFGANIIRSDIRILIEQKFREKNIVIPFPITTVQIMK